MTFSLLNRYVTLFIHISECLVLVMCAFPFAYKMFSETSYLSGLLLIAASCLLPILGNWLWGATSFKFTIDEEGVKYETRKSSWSIPWTEVEAIWLLPDRYGRFTKNNFICFLTKDANPIGVCGYMFFKENIFGIQYRKGIVDHIKKYTDMQIRLIDYVEKK